MRWFNRTLTEPGKPIRWWPVAWPPCGRNHGHIKCERTSSYSRPDMTITDYSNSAARELAVEWHGLVVIPPRRRERRTENRVSFIRRVHFTEACRKFKHCTGGQQSSSVCQFARERPKSPLNLLPVSTYSEIGPSIPCTFATVHPGGIISSSSQSTPVNGTCSSRRLGSCEKSATPSGPPITASASTGGLPPSWRKAQPHGECCRMLL